MFSQDKSPKTKLPGKCSLATHSVVWEPAALVSPGILLEMQTLSPIPPPNLWHLTKILCWSIDILEFETLWPVGLLISNLWMTHVRGPLPASGCRSTCLFSPTFITHSRIGCKKGHKEEELSEISFFPEQKVDATLLWPHLALKSSFSSEILSACPVLVILMNWASWEPMFLPPHCLKPANGK